MSVLLLLIYCFVCGGFCVGLCFVMHFFVSSFATILARKRELVDLLTCLPVSVLWLFLTVLYVGLQYVIVVFPKIALICWAHVGPMWTVHIRFVDPALAIHIGPTQLCSWDQRGTNMMAPRRANVWSYVASK